MIFESCLCSVLGAGLLLMPVILSGDSKGFDFVDETVNRFCSILDLPDFAYWSSFWVQMLPYGCVLLAWPILNFLSKIDYGAYY